MARRLELAARRLYPGAEQLVHLDAAGIGLVAEPAQAAVEAFLAEAGVDPLGAHHGGRLDHARAAVARLIGAQPDQIALTPSTSAGLNAVASAIGVGRGDNVVVSELDFISVVAPFQEQCRAGGGVLRVVEGDAGTLPASRVIETIDARTRAVVLSTVVWTSGYRIDLDSIGRACREREIPLIVDAIQQVGSVRFDVSAAHVDVVVCGGHKWLGSPSGMGFVYAGDEFCERYAPPLPYAPTALPAGADWQTLWSDPDFSPVRDFPQPAGARRFEIGCHHAAMSACGLAAAVEVIESAGPEQVEQHVIELGNALARELDELGLEVVTDLDDRHRSGITTFRAGKSTEDDVALRNFLRERGIVTIVRYTKGSGGVRISCHLYNNFDDVDALLVGVRAGLG